MIMGTKLLFHINHDGIQLGHQRNPLKLELHENNLTIHVFFGRKFTGNIMFFFFLIPPMHVNSYFQKTLRNMQYLF